ncbi:MAG: M20/M25/M40 family metallo-hydrolase [Deferribacteres bacterium]|nr:M20/M25/M40 family metallo-hydrolase [candidate division KSB1 bacterium]MCB9511282.1 M20/M25/M40 family metallo-hydrolase [Deferribacteres bacterium]
MSRKVTLFFTRAIALMAILSLPAIASAQQADIHQVVAALLGDTPMIADLRELTDEIGGRPTGSEANLKSVEWGLQKFKQAGVTARKEAFQMPRFWLERETRVSISGDASFSPSAVAMTFSVATGSDGQTASLVDGGFGTEADFARLGAAAKGAFMLVETHELLDIDGLFQEYADAVGTEKRALAADVAGVIYMSSRPKGLLYRHNASLGPDNKKPMMVMEREGAQRALRLLRAGKTLSITAYIDVDDRGPYDSYNVIGEIKGSEKPQEIVVIGAHLDSWGLGTGGNDNGCNVVMMIDIARQMKKIGLKPKRTIRFVLWNGEEQGLVGSWRYTQAHLDEMDNHVMATSIDIGSGRITGFFTNGRADILPAVDKALEPVGGLGPFVNINAPIVGTDNYDFMMQGVANLVGNHDPYNYGPNYHAESDTFDKVDLRQIRVNAAIVAALTYGFANMEVTWKRQSRADIQNLIDSTDLGVQMGYFNLMPGWLDGSRGRK